MLIILMLIIRTDFYVIRLKIMYRVDFHVNLCKSSHEKSCELWLWSSYCITVTLL